MCKAYVPREKEQEFRKAMHLLVVKSFVYERDDGLMEAIADAMTETPSKPDDHGGAGASSEFPCLKNHLISLLFFHLLKNVVYSFLY